MTLALQLACLCLAVALAALVVAFHEWRSRKRAADERWVDELISRHRQDLQKRYRNGQFRSKPTWTHKR